MSIILKGIDMPKNGEMHHINIYDNGNTYITTSNILYETDRKDVEAMQIPTPHGRIGDLDEIQSKAYERYFNNTISPYGLYEVNRAIENAPIILKAEE